MKSQQILTDKVFMSETGLYCAMDSCYKFTDSPERSNLYLAPWAQQKLSKLILSQNSNQSTFASPIFDILF